MNNERLTMLALTLIAVAGLFVLGDVGKELLIAIASGLVGYLKGSEDKE